MYYSSLDLNYDGKRHRVGRLTRAKTSKLSRSSGFSLSLESVVLKCYSILEKVMGVTRSVPTKENGKEEIQVMEGGDVTEPAVLLEIGTHIVQEMKKCGK